MAGKAAAIGQGRKVSAAKITTTTGREPLQKTTTQQTKVVLKPSLSKTIAPSQNNRLLAVVRLRGDVAATREIRDTLRLLNLRRVNTCSLFPDTPSVRGMLQKVGGFVAWGMASEGMVQRLADKRGNGKETRVFRLSPTTLRSKHIAYPRGDLGFRGDKINDLLKEMA